MIPLSDRKITVSRSRMDHCSLPVFGSVASNSILVSEAPAKRGAFAFREELFTTEAECSFEK